MGGPDVGDVWNPGELRLLSDSVSAEGRALMATLAVHGLRSAPVVVVESTEYGNDLDRTVHLRQTRDRLLLSERLVRTRLVVEAREFGDQMVQVPFAEDQDVIEKLPAERSREPFRERVHVRRADRDPDDAGIEGGKGPHEAGAELRVVVADQHLRSLPVDGGVASLLRAQVEEEEDEDLPKPSIVRLHEVRRPGDMICARTSTSRDCSRHEVEMAAYSVEPYAC
jgi:hypothetical protein